MDNVFISYRRDDSGGYARAIYEYLVRRFGPSAVFMDLETLRPGSDFVAQIRQTLVHTKVMLVLIGKDWLAADENGEPRIQNANDFVRLEIALALQAGIPIIPVLLGSAAMPGESNLPEDIRAFARHHAVTVTHARFAADMEPLASSVASALGVASGWGRVRRVAEGVCRRARAPVATYVGLIALNAVVAAYLVRRVSILQGKVRLPTELGLPLAEVGLLGVTAIALAVLILVPAFYRYRVAGMVRGLRWAGVLQGVLLVLLCGLMAFFVFVIQPDHARYVESLGSPTLMNFAAEQKALWVFLASLSMPLLLLIAARRVRNTADSLLRSTGQPKG